MADPLSRLEFEDHASGLIVRRRVAISRILLYWRWAIWESVGKEQPVIVLEGLTFRYGAARRKASAAMTDRW